MTSLLPDEIIWKLKEASRLPKYKRREAIDMVLTYAKLCYPSKFVQPVIPINDILIEMKPLTESTL